MTTLFALESTDSDYSEGPDSTFTSEGVEYSVDKVLDVIRKKKLKPVELRTHKDYLGWALFEVTGDGKQVKDTLDKKRIKAADTSIPIIVIKSDVYGLIVVDGTHRLAKAYFIERKKTLPSYILTVDDIKDCVV